MMLKKSTDSRMLGSVSGVKASMSRGRPGTAAEIVLSDPRAERSSASRHG